MSLQTACCRYLPMTVAPFGLLAVGVGLFVSMPDPLRQSDYVKALVPALLVVLASLWARWRHPEARPTEV
ncbi:hypothetical protein ACKVMT_00450 [Halobacteriales archaeon Cl-PHB]